MSVSLEPAVLYEDAGIIVVNKPAGLLVHHARHTAGEATLVDWLLAWYPELRRVGDDPQVRPGIVHRLDRDTSGIMIIPRTQAMFDWLKRQFADRKIGKTYRAVVAGAVRNDTGTIDAPIGIANGSTKRSVHRTRLQKEAVTDYAVRERFGDRATLLDVQPRTGRTHQIRVHLASLGHPVLGDRLYGPRGRKEKPQKSLITPPRLMLHAASLTVPFPDGRSIRFDADPDAIFAGFLEEIRTSAP
jgi:23S rRNA pseudouridine1911/1915/1917 synthase